MFASLRELDARTIATLVSVVAALGSGAGFWQAKSTASAAGGNQQICCQGWHEVYVKVESLENDLIDAFEALDECRAEAP